MKEFLQSKYVRYAGYGVLAAAAAISLATQDWWKAAIAGVLLVLFWWSDRGIQSEEDAGAKE
ncbi:MULTISPECIES: hypothetical protein [unclassified Actinobaculum]|uniref:hypothetical protein n=1 Tax=unclassified Actinobaculum TaxID=2609299 RepID=UPI000D52A410|nr:MULTISPECIES: hypothetical protein [unclassified Actinobaculum]AWE41543.1 hypothetical protein DDD63_00750 [Actinobaculum sp. 313]RTE48024.1 hypothetical protein EKN07_11160 [Actinobaculum sp. 352]